MYRFIEKTIRSEINSPILTANNPIFMRRLHDNRGNIGFIIGRMMLAIKLLDNVLILVSSNKPINILKISCSVAKSSNLLIPETFDLLMKR